MLYHSSRTGSYDSDQSGYIYNTPFQISNFKFTPPTFILLYYRVERFSPGDERVESAR